jgi:hypothetical protein
LVLVGAVQILIYCALLKTSRLAERAWLSFQLVEIVGLKEIEKIRQDHKLLFDDKDTIFYQLVVRYALINSGKTPARVIEGAIAFEMVDSSKLPAEPKYAEVNRIPYLVAPNRPFRNIQGMVFDQGEIAAFIKNERAFILFGFVRYLDVHNRPILGGGVSTDCRRRSV